MFRSKIHPLNITQNDHAQMAAHIAYFWGNEAFDRPGVPFDAFIKAVRFHDREYGFVDNHAIDDGREADWLKLKRTALAMRSDDPLVDAIIMMHVKRLLSYGTIAERVELLGQADALVHEFVDQTAYTYEQMGWIDRIMNLCDSIAFHFSFGSVVESSFEVSPRWNDDKTLTITYQVDEKGDIRVKPWPFNEDHIMGFVVGYQRAGYPDALEPEILAYQLSSFDA